MEKESQSDETPFQPIKDEILSDEGVCSDVFEFCDRNDLVLKKIINYDPNKSLSRKLKEIGDYLKLAQEKFPEQYAKYFPKTQIVVGKNVKGRDALYIVQEKIIGENIRERKLPEEAKQALKELLSFLIDLYVQTFDGEEGWIVEILNRDNYIYGHKEREDKSKDTIYFIDFTPMYLRSIPEMSREIVSIVDEFLSEEDQNELLAKLDVLKQK
jgi:hypothetical protein